MASQKQIEANRRKAQRSTGPTSDLGKAVARFNALKHGMTADAEILPYEDEDSYAELRETPIAQYRPLGSSEVVLASMKLATLAALDTLRASHESGRLSDSGYHRTTCPNRTRHCGYHDDRMSIVHVKHFSLREKGLAARSGAR
jgi:hypothetical protein